MSMDPYIRTLLAKDTDCYGSFSPSDGECSICSLSSPCSADRVRKFRSLVDQFRLVRNQVVIVDNDLESLLSSGPDDPPKTPTARPARAASSGRTSSGRTSPAPAAPPASSPTSPPASPKRMVFEALDDSLCSGCHKPILKGMRMYHQDMSVYHEECCA